MSELEIFSTIFIPATWIIASYLLGSIAFGILVSKFFKLPDPRTIGSGNIGATNVLRSGKKLAALVTLLGDIVKGWLPVWLAIESNMLVWVIAAVGLAVFFGHLYPIYYKFKGGKGVATALGVMLAISPMLALATLTTWIIVFAISRYSSLSAIIAATLAPIFAWLILSYNEYIISVFIMAIFLVWRHKSNIQKLLAGTESGFGKR